TLRGAAVAAAAFAFALSLAQRQLSTPVRFVRRGVRSVTGSLDLTTGVREPVTAATLLRAPESALRLLSAATPLLATAPVPPGAGRVDLAADGRRAAAGRAPPR